MVSVVTANGGRLLVGRPAKGHRPGQPAGSLLDLAAVMGLAVLGRRLGLGERSEKRGNRVHARPSRRRHSRQCAGLLPCVTDVRPCRRRRCPFQRSATGLPSPPNSRATESAQRPAAIRMRVFIVFSCRPSGEPASMPFCDDRLIVQSPRLDSSKKSRSAGRSGPGAAARTASVTVAISGLSNFQHCQNSGTSRCTSDIRTNEPSAKYGAAAPVGNMPQPRPARTAASEPLCGGHVVHRSADAAAKCLAHQHVLQRIVAVPGQRRRAGHCVGREPVGQVPRAKGDVGHRHVAHHPERHHPASGHRRALGGDRPHHRAFAQQPRPSGPGPRSGGRTASPATGRTRR